MEEGKETKGHRRELYAPRAEGRESEQCRQHHGSSRAPLCPKAAIIGQATPAPSSARNGGQLHREREGIYGPASPACRGVRNGPEGLEGGVGGREGDGRGRGRWQRVEGEHARHPGRL